MKILVKKSTLGLVLQWAQRAFLAAAVSTLGYCGFVLVDAWIYQNRESRQLDQLLPERPEANRRASPTASTAPAGLIGRIEIPRLGVSIIVAEGTSGAVLRRAVGHIRGTALPGQPGNVGISGHRDTFFRPLRNIRQNDIITLTTVAGEFQYRVVSARVVDPHDVAVLDPGDREVLTLVTCYPFYFVGAAPDRFVVRAERAADGAVTHQQAQPDRLESHFDTGRKSD